MQDDFNIYIYNYFIIRIDELIIFDCSKSNNFSVDHINHWYLLIFLNHADTLAHYKNTSALTQILEHEIWNMYYNIFYSHTYEIFDKGGYVCFSYIHNSDRRTSSLASSSVYNNRNSHKVTTIKRIRKKKEENFLETLKTLRKSVNMSRKTRLKRSSLTISRTFDCSIALDANTTKQ